MVAGLMVNTGRRICTLGVSVDALTLDEASAEVIRLLSDKTECCHYVVTPNLDHAVKLTENRAFALAYEEASLVLPDGMPLLWGARLLGTPLQERVAGSDLGPRVLQDAPDGTRVFVLGASEDANRRAAVKIAELYPNVIVAGRLSPPFGFETSDAWSLKIVDAILTSSADLIIVGLGAPKQELWVHAHRAKLPGTVALCIGATIDFLAGDKRRAPAWMQRVGLEWLHRACSEPRRLLARYAKDAVRLPLLLWRDQRTRRRLTA